MKICSSDNRYTSVIFLQKVMFVHEMDNLSDGV